MRYKINIRRDTRATRLITVAETRCPRYYRLFPYFRHNVAASQTSENGH
jgi:hypothetical protein